MTYTNTDQEQSEFEAWWQAHGQFCRAGGGDYEKTFAYRAWQAARRAPAVPMPQGYKITEDQHVAAVKVLQRASGVDGLPQRMLDAMLAAAPQPPEEAPVQLPDDTAPLEDFQEGQWWVVELDKIANLSYGSAVIVTADMKRAVAVVHHMLRSASYTAQPGWCDGCSPDNCCGCGPASACPGAAQVK